MLVSNGELSTLNKLFKKSLGQTTFVQIGLSIGFIGGLYFLEVFIPSYSIRFLTIPITILLLLSQLAQTLSGAMAIYLRSFKEEPFIYLSILNAVLMILAVFIVLKKFGFTTYIITETAILCLIILPLAFFVYTKKNNR